MSKGKIVHYPGGFGKEIYASGPNGDVIKSVTRAMGNESITRVDIPKGKMSEMTTTTI